MKAFTWVIVSDDLHPNIFDHSGHLHWEIIFWGVVFGVDNIFVIFKIKIFGEVWLIITLDSLIPILTSPPPEVFIETQKSAFKCFGSLSFAPTFSPHSGQVTCILVFGTYLMMTHWLSTWVLAIFSPITTPIGASSLSHDHVSFVHKSFGFIAPWLINLHWLIRFRCSVLLSWCCLQWWQKELNLYNHLFTQWFRSWKKGNNVAFQTFEILQQF